MQELTITQPVRFIKRNHDIGTTWTSVVVSFEDPDGSCLANLLKQDIYMFSTKVTTQAWKTKPCIKKCDRCHALAHDTKACQRQPRCKSYGSMYHTSNLRRASCTNCTGQPSDVECTHLKCVNCQGNHAADFDKCPACTNYRSPVARSYHKRNAPWPTTEDNNQGMGEEP